MRPEERDPACLWDMWRAAEGVVRMISGLSLDAFLGPGQEITRLAVERGLEILGEAARRVSAGFCDAHPELPWKDVVGLRNFISHQYDKVNYSEIYRIVRGRIPALVGMLARLLPPPPQVED